MTPPARQSYAGENGLARARGIRARSADLTPNMQTVCISRFGPSANSATTAGILVPLLPKARPVRPPPAQPRPPAPQAAAAPGSTRSGPFSPVRSAGTAETTRDLARCPGHDPARAPAPGRPCPSW